MSRIYDAHQRASLERKGTEETDTAKQRAEPFAAPGIDDLPPTKADVILENIAWHPWNPSIASLPTLEDHGEGIEQFRGLRSQIYKFRDQAALKTILISSGEPAEGKTFVAANLAISLASNKNNRVLLIDADLRSPALDTEYLAGTVELGNILQRNRTPRIVEAGHLHSFPNLTFIPAGTGGDNSLELIANHRIEELIATLSLHFDWILIDSPPALAFADAIDLARAADAVLLVARAATTPFGVAQRTQAAFSSSRILGFVLNAVKNAPRDTSYYYSKQEAGDGLNWRKDKRR